MLSYELCKKLKEAGFPQDSEGQWVKSSDGGLSVWSQFEISELQTSKHELLNVKHPTLSELIEACGNDFLLWKYEGGWRAFAPDYTDYVVDNAVDAGPGAVCRGKIPEEALANLWLQLNKK